jgi:cytochrome P450
MEPELLGIVTKLIDGLAGRNRIDVVDDLAYPFPVAVICELLGVPHEDEPRFHAWVEKGMESLDPKLDPTEQAAVYHTVQVPMAARTRGVSTGSRMPARWPASCRSPGFPRLGVQVR